MGIKKGRPHRRRGARDGRPARDRVDPLHRIDLDRRWAEAEDDWPADEPRTAADGPRPAPGEHR